MNSPRWRAVCLFAATTAACGARDDCAQCRSPDDLSSAVQTVVDAHVTITSRQPVTFTSLARITAIAADPATGSLAAVDGMTGLVGMFDTRADRMTGYSGGKGDAPGETRCASGIAFGENGIVVLDNCRNRFVSVAPVVNRAEQLIPDVGLGGLSPYGRFGWLNDTLVFSRQSSPLNNKEDRHGVRRGVDELVVQTASGSAVVDQTPSLWVNVSVRRSPLLVPVPFTHRLTWDISASSRLIAVSRDSSSRVAVKNARGQVQHVLQTSLEPSPVDDEDRRATFENLQAEFPLERLNLERIRFPRWKPAIRSLRFDPTGFLWVRLSGVSSTPRPDSVPVLRWAPGSRYAARFTLPCFPAAFVSENEFACRARTELGVEYVQLYRFALTVRDTAATK